MLSVVYKAGPSFGADRRFGAESKREGAKGKGQKEKATNKKQKHKAQESRHQQFVLGVRLTFCRLNIIGLEAKLKPVKTLKTPK